MENLNFAVRSILFHHDHSQPGKDEKNITRPKIKVKKSNEQPEEGAVPGSRLHPKMVMVPRLKYLRVIRFEEDPADAGYSGHHAKPDEG